MAKNVFRLFKVSDKELLHQLEAIADGLNVKNSKFTFSFSTEHQKPLLIICNELTENKELQDILSTNSVIFARFILDLPSFGNLVIDREENSDKATLTFDNQLEPIKTALLLETAHKHLRVYGRTESIDKLLGDELGEFYRRREEALLKLEDIIQNQITENEEYRRRVHKQNEEFKQQLKAEFEEEQKRSKTEFEKKNKELLSRETTLENRIRDLDDRSSRHARRQIRQDLKSIISQRGKEFSLTRRTSYKRLPIHLLFLILVIASGIFVIRSFLDQSNPPAGINPYYLMIRLPLSAIAFGAAVIFYIRWNDNWFRQHADEEFRLKQLELDIDRASWVVEMALEWRDEKGTEIPQELIDRLSQNLFVGQTMYETTRHPSEDLASAMLGASSGLSVKVPGFGEVRYDRRGIKRFKKALEEANEQDSYYGTNKHQPILNYQLILFRGYSEAIPL